VDEHAENGAGDAAASEEAAAGETNAGGMDNE
jgi:hypothetical protein